MKSCMHMVGMIVWLLTAAGCLHLGLLALGYDPLVTLNISHLAPYAMGLFGLAGLASLAMFFMGCGGCSCCKNTSNSSHNNYNNH